MFLGWRAKVYGKEEWDMYNENSWYQRYSRRCMRESQDVQRKMMDIMLKKVNMRHNIKMRSSVYHAGGGWVTWSTHRCWPLTLQHVTAKRIIMHNAWEMNHHAWCMEQNHHAWCMEVKSLHLAHRRWSSCSMHGRWIIVLIAWNRKDDRDNFPGNLHEAKISKEPLGAKPGLISENISMHKTQKGCVIERERKGGEQIEWMVTHNISNFWCSVKTHRKVILVNVWIDGCMEFHCFGEVLTVCQVLQVLRLNRNNEEDWKVPCKIFFSNLLRERAWWSACWNFFA